MSIKSHHKQRSSKPLVSPGQSVFLAFLGIVAFCYAGILVNHLVNRTSTAHPPSETGDVAFDAREYLRFVKAPCLSKSLTELLADDTFTPVATDDIPLLGKDAPDFSLPYEGDVQLQLSRQLKKGPVILVFYFGYYCSHCVAQLFALNADLKHFHELGAEVVAVSSDSPEITAARFAKYGRFDFPVVSDADNHVAQAYGVYRPAQGDRDQELLHGTFVIGKDGRVLWGSTGLQPFLDNKSLLFIIASVNRVTNGNQTAEQ